MSENEKIDQSAIPNVENPSLKSVKNTQNQEQPIPFPPLTDEIKRYMFKKILRNPPNKEIKKQIEEELANLTKNNTKLNNE